MQRKKHGYQVNVSRQKSWFYTEETLPGYIKSQLAMIHVLPQCIPLKRDADVYQHGTYKHYIRGELPDIGYQLSESYYVLILTTEEVNSLALSSENV
jgi:hypothetical protein